MIRVLFIARYRDATMRRKVEYLARQSDLQLWNVYPRLWQDELLRVEQAATLTASYPHTAMPMLGRPSDPHRSLYRSLAFEMRRFRPDIIHAEEEPDSLAALQITVARRFLAPKATLILNSWQNIHRPRAWYVRAITRHSLRESDAIFCASLEAAAVLRQLGYQRPAIVLPAVGVDTQTFTPRTQPRGADHIFSVGYVGRFAAEKGLGTLIDALARLTQETDLPPMRAVFIGDGPARASFAGHIASAGLADRITLKPAMPPAQVAQEMQELDALVLPSRTTPTWKEQFGRVLVEAMACKVPVVGSDSGAIPEVIGDAGLIFPEADAGQLADSLRRLINSPGLCQELAERGYARAMRCYTQYAIAQQTADLYRTFTAQDAHHG